MSDQLKNKTPVISQSSIDFQHLSEDGIVKLCRKVYESLLPEERMRLLEKNENPNLKASLTLDENFQLEIEIDNIQTGQKQSLVRTTVYLFNEEKILKGKTNDNGRLRLQLPKTALEGVTEDDPLYITLRSPEGNIDFAIENSKQLPINLVALPGETRNK